MIKYYFQRGFSKSIQSRRRLTTYFFQLCSVNQSLSLTGCVYLSPYKRLKGVWACQIWVLAASKSITTAHVDSITSQRTFMAPGESSTEELKRHHRQLKMARYKEKLESIDSTLSLHLLRLVNQLRDKGASSWLNAMPFADQGLALNKQEFRDSLRLRYNLPLVNLQSLCVWG